jgi:hypothetical protein
VVDGARRALEDEVAEDSLSEKYMQIDAGSMHSTPDTDARGVRADATPRENNV